jgi:competence protein ComEC
MSDSFRHRDLARGFLCGTAIENPKDRNTFQQTGLIHLLVVSGGHLQILSLLLLAPIPRVFRRNKAFRFSLWVLLFSYCLITGFQAPVVRAFVGRVLTSLSQFWKWNWDLGKIQIAAGLMCLILFPAWLKSLSFYLSWLASMGFLLGPLCFSYRNSKTRPSFLQTLLTCALIQAFVAVVFCSFSWLGVLMNAVVAAPLAVLLLFLSGLPILHPSFISWCDRIWDFLLLTLDQTRLLANAPANVDFSRLQWLFLWSFLVLLQILLHLIYQQRYRHSHA